MRHRRVADNSILFKLIFQNIFSFSAKANYFNLTLNAIFCADNAK